MPSRKNDKGSRNESKILPPHMKQGRLRKEDVICSICCDVYLEPVTFPCNHTVCRSCFISQLEETLLCPFCRYRLSVWSRRNIKNNTIVNIQFTARIEKEFPHLLAKRRLEENSQIKVDDEDPEDGLIRVTNINRLLESDEESEEDSLNITRDMEFCEPGQIAKDFDNIFQQHRLDLEKRLREEEEASRHAIAEILKDGYSESVSVHDLTASQEQSDFCLAQELQSQTFGFPSPVVSHTNSKSWNQKSIFGKTPSRTVKRKSTVASTVQKPQSSKRNRLSSLVASPSQRALTRPKTISHGAKQSQISSFFGSPSVSHKSLSQGSSLDSRPSSSASDDLRSSDEFSLDGFANSNSFTQEAFPSPPRSQICLSTSTQHSSQSQPCLSPYVSSSSSFFSATSQSATSSSGTSQYVESFAPRLSHRHYPPPPPRSLIPCPHIGSFLSQQSNRNAENEDNTTAIIDALAEIDEKSAAHNMHDLFSKLKNSTPPSTPEKKRIQPEDLLPKRSAQKPLIGSSPIRNGVSDRLLPIVLVEKCDKELTMDLVTGLNRISSTVSHFSSKSTEKKVKLDENGNVQDPQYSEYSNKRNVRRNIFHGNVSSQTSEASGNLLSEKQSPELITKYQLVQEKGDATPEDSNKAKKKLNNSTSKEEKLISEELQIDIKIKCEPLSPRNLRAPSKTTEAERLLLDQEIVLTKYEQMQKDAQLALHLQRLFDNETVFRGKNAPTSDKYSIRRWLRKTK